MADTPPPQNLNVPRIEAALAKALPGVRFETGHSIGTMVWSGQAWRFHLDISLRARRISFADEAPGTGRILIVEKYNGNTKVLRNEGIKDVADLQGQLVWLRGFLLGISEVVNRAVDEPPPEPLADIFKDDLL